MSESACKTVLTVTLPFPSPELFPNRAKGRHWTTVSGIKSKAFSDGHYLTFNAMNGYSGEWYPTHGEVPITLTFNAPDRRHRDLDNCLAALKSHLDGVAAALSMNDREFAPITIKRGEVVKGGAVKVEIGT